jgi:hypothetical protein
MSDAIASTTIHRYFVDEAGDLTFFGSRGQPAIGKPGVSRYFIVGAALIHEADKLQRTLTRLRACLLADPYFVGVPSMSPHAAKTARMFHATDDIPEVRRDVFSVLRTSKVEIYAAFRRKTSTAAQLRTHHERTGTKPGAEAIYGDLVASIFESRLHLAERTHIVFAQRGKSTRNMTLAVAIERAKAQFELKSEQRVSRPTSISSNEPSEVVGLQVVDYYLWALQRLLERGEERYVNFLGPAYRLIIDRDDTRRSIHGEHYSVVADLVAQKDNARLLG